MKVICIDKKYYRDEFPQNEVNILDEFEVLSMCGSLYEFTKYPNILWLPCNFIPLSSIDETEMILKTKNEVI